MARGTGKTTQQMKSAPTGAVFVWCNAHLYYPRMLAKRIGRDDLQIQAPSWLEDRWRGMKMTGLVLDHAAELTDRQWEGYQCALAQIR
jgi:hypothetical protein